MRTRLDAGCTKGRERQAKLLRRVKTLLRTGGVVVENVRRRAGMAEGSCLERGTRALAPSGRSYLQCDVALGHVLWKSVPAAMKE